MEIRCFACFNLSMNFYLQSTKSQAKGISECFAVRRNPGATVGRKIYLCLDLGWNEKEKKEKKDVHQDCVFDWPTVLRCTHRHIGAWATSRRHYTCLSRTSDQPPVCVARHRQKQWWNHCRTRAGSVQSSLRPAWARDTARSLPELKESQVQVSRSLCVCVWPAAGKVDDRVLTPKNPRGAGQEDEQEAGVRGHCCRRSRSGERAEQRKEPRAVQTTIPDRSRAFSPLPTSFEWSRVRRKTLTSSRKWNAFKAQLAE